MRLPLLLTAAVFLFAGCGGNDGGSSTEDPNRPPNELFAGACGSCHTLAAADTDGSFGPNLDDLAPDEARVSAAIADGPGSMPAGLLDGAAAEAVAVYVAESAGG